ncbi:MAG TPA: PQQ-dependent sugar dehydrogenase [Mucilaginibacter sp.]|nr:PQQ-dependent sugar dehydrogenase [Mucilaginibacter sp.]
MKKLCLLIGAIGFVMFNACKSAPETKDTSQTDSLGGRPTASVTSSGLTLPAGFSAVVLAENLNQPRHLIVTPQSDIYIHLASPSNGAGVVVLHDDGTKASAKTTFGNYGGTGIALKDGYLYVSSNSDIYRYKLDANNQVVNTSAPETVVSGLTNKRMHNSKSITLDNAGNIYVNIGAYSNICSDYDKDKTGCPVLNDAGGIWMFKANKLNQKQSDGVRFATGLRNVVGLDWNQQDNQLFVMQHGRDALHDLYPDLYSTKQSADLPAECMYALKEGDNAGWPYVYYDWIQEKLMQGPEYGGDGKKEADAKYLRPVAAYPGHFAPDGLLFYTGDQFPERYKNGAFIAFHGSWNRAPERQEGYCVVFQPFKNGKPDGKYEIFADGFAGPDKSPGGALHRPCGLAQGPDGSLYVTDDQKGTLYKISYKK